ncbi:UTP--glucose-1-phosphate uridylyltransferase [Nocardioides panacis]|uniref:UTP--glucose-1-phosphate uridylyltransferase n=1 Tax=Nocardioides panacis TaxID=2849501 RepID=A0A975SYJ6_9ACTN|nr:UTP--glucose-1-phosphate uridylyltransferase [Nocardioides panacis]QWZ08353.1 UTP--glucose-1-phosphate uridylyltransferase [Nocardioides panacis]
MSDEGLQQARAKMADAGVDPVAVDVFEHYYRMVESGETGMIPESTVEPVDIPALADADLPSPVPVDGLGRTVVVKLNGGLGTSMGLDRAKSLLEVREGLTFLDVIARQVLWAREEYGVRLPLVFMDSFRTSADTTQALAGYDLSADGLPLDFLQNKEPKLRADDLTPVTWEPDPDLEWCPPGHGDLYPALRGSGLLDRLIEAGYTQAFVSNSDNLGATPDPGVAEWFARSGAPFAIEAVRRTPSDRKGGHFARRTADGRIVLRETAQTLEEDQDALADLSRHKFCSTNNLWFDLVAMRDELDRRDGVLGLALIKNTKTVDPSDPSSPEVIQIESAMGAAVEVFADAQLIEVTRARFLPVKTTNDLLVLRSDCYRLEESHHLVLEDGVDAVPFVDLDPKHFKLVGGFDARFPDGVPSLKAAEELVVEGDWTFGAGVTVTGRAHLQGPGGRVDEGVTLSG